MTRSDGKHATRRLPAGTGDAGALAGESAELSATEQAAMRGLFWNNVVRDLLNGLAVLSQHQPEMFDGRFAVLTHGGERIPIAQVFPVFACSIPGTAQDRACSRAVQSTVFRIQTPGGEVFTLPLHEIRGMHAMTPELIQQLQQAAEGETDEDGDESGGKDGKPKSPFGFAAYSSLPKGPLRPEPAPEHPTE